MLKNPGLERLVGWQNNMRLFITILFLSSLSLAQVAGGSQGALNNGGTTFTGSSTLTGSSLIDQGISVTQIPPPKGFAGLHVTLTGNANPPIQNTWLRISLADGVSWAQMASGQTVGSYTSCPPAAPTSPTDPCYNWTKFDTWTAFAKTANYGVILNIQNTPRYIAANNSDATCTVPSGFVTPAGTCTPPTDVNCDGTGTDLTLINFAKALMAHMSATWQTTHQMPSYYEGWQEPDINSNWDNTYINGTLCAATANASQKIMKRMMSDLSSTIKGINTSALVTTPSPSNGVTAYASGGWSDTYLAQGGGAFADLCTTHGYTNAGSVCSAAAPVVNPILKSQFGIHINQVGNNGFPPTTVPVGVLRTLGSATNWRDIETSAGVYNFTGFDTVVTAAVNNGSEIEYPLYTTPTFYSRSGNFDAPTDVNCDGTGTDQHFKDFVTAIGNHLVNGQKAANVIKYWEIWNEPNVTGEWTQNGTSCQYTILVRFAADAKTILRGINSNVKIISPPYTSGSTAVVTGTTGFVNANVVGFGTGLQQVDYISYHGYPASGQTPEIYNGLPTSIRGISAGVAALPLWDDEGSWGRQNDCNTNTLLGAWLARRFIVNLSNAVAKTNFYGWDFTYDTSGTVPACGAGAPTGFGWLIDTGGTTANGCTLTNGVFLCPMATAWQQVTNWLIGSAFNSNPGCSQASNFYTCPITESDGRQAVIAWQAITGSTTPYTPVSTTVQYRDLTGLTTTYAGGSITVGNSPLIFESAPVTVPTSTTSNHIWVVTMENTSAASTDPGATSSTNSSYRRYVYNNTVDMPYFNNTLVPLGTKLTQMYSDTHSSWPAWIYLTTGNFPCGPTNKAGDCTTSPALGPCSNSSCLRNEQCWNANNLVRQARATVGSADMWSEGMCFDGNQADNTTGAATSVSKNCAGYKRGHNPLMNYSDTSQGTAAGPSTADPTAAFGCSTSGHFLDNKTTATASDAAGSEAKLIASINTNPTGLHYITPSLGSDMHGQCSTCSYNLGNGDGTLVAADNWMKLVVGALLQTPAFQPGGDGLLLIMWDEGNIINGGNPLGTATDDLCTSSTHGCGGHVPALIIGPSVQRGISLSITYHLADLERLICDSMGTASCPGAGATAAQIPAFVAATGCPRPESVSTMASVMNTALTRNSAPAIPIADTESNWGAVSNITDANYQEAYAVRHALLQAFQGFLFDAWMAYDAPQSLTTPVGTTLNATGTAWGQATSWLTGMTLSGPCTCTGASCAATPPVGTFKCEMTGPNNYTAEIAWDSTAMPPLSCSNPQCGNTTYTAPVGTDQWRDLVGVTHMGSPTAIGSYPIIVENNIATNNNGSCSTPTYPFTAANFSIGYNKPGPAGADLLGASTERLFNIFPNTDFPSWANMQTGATTFNYAPLDFWVSFSTTNTKQLLEHISRVPTFISSNATDTTCSPTGTCYAPTDLASGDTTFKDFVSRVVSRDGCTTTNTVGCVKYWGFINEPNSQAYWRTGTAPADNGTTYANYVQMFKDFSSTVHGINANLCVMSGDPQGTSTSITSGSAGWLNKVLPQLSGVDSAGHPFVDIVGFHPYLNTSGGVVNSPSDTSNGQDINIKFVKQAMGAAGMGALPIWATEYYALGTMPDTTGNNTDQYLTQDQYILYESGVVNSFWYEPDISPITVGQSLYTDTTFATLNSAGLAWRQVKANLIGTQPVNTTCSRVTSTEITCAFKNPQSGAQYLAAWDVSAAPATISCSQYVQYTQTDGTLKACPFGGNVLLSNSPIWLQSGTQNAPSGGNAGRANDWPY